MNTLIKTLTIQEARLNRITGGRRLAIADFEGRIEIYERQALVPILGHTAKGVKSIYASFILSDDIRYCTDTAINTAMVFEADATVLKSDGEREKFLFSGLRLVDNDPISGEIIFEITDLYLIRSLLSEK